MVEESSWVITQWRNALDVSVPADNWLVENLEAFLKKIALRDYASSLLRPASIQPLGQYRIPLKDHAWKTACLLTEDIWA
eukprot:1377872-Pleurochrysis_carterae.AAC.1